MLIERDGVIAQFVMSCRVFGLGIERAVLAELANAARARGATLSAVLRETERNAPCRGAYREAGWSLAGDVWIAPEISPPVPHVTLVRE